jgi:hypothetical protein
MPFDSPDLNLGKLLEDVGCGKVQLPDFQREWKWDDDRIRGLLASVSLGHPVGVVMMLEVGGPEVRFAPKVISGVDPTSAGTVELLILDGQQRLTSLYQSLMSDEPVNTTDSRGKRLRRWYYIDIARALDPSSDREDEALLSVPEDRVIRSDFGRVVERDFSSLRKECEAEVFPLASVFDPAAIFEWQNEFLKVDPADGAQRSARWNEFYTRVLSNFIQYTVPVIVLKRSTPKEAVCTVFEKVNTGGVALNVFELLTATFASDDFRLKDDWAERSERLAKRPALQSIENTDLLQIVTLLATRKRRVGFSPTQAEPVAPGITCKRKDVLRLTLEDYQQWAEPATEALVWASNFLAQEKIFRAADVPYRTQLVPLGAIKVALGSKADAWGSAAKLRQWFWCGVLGELYSGTTETRFARDLEQVVPWIIEDGPTPTTVAEATFRAGRLLTLRTRNSAAYKGVYALLMRKKCHDWVKREPFDMANFFEYQIDIHHIFPKAWCDKNGVDRQRRESIVNKTPLSYDTNRAIGGRSPAEYVPLVERKAGLASPELDAIISEHLIDPSLLRGADFGAFFAARFEGVLELIADAMGKDPVRDDLASEGEAEIFEDEGEDIDEQDLVFEESGHPVEVGV